MGNSLRPFAVAGLVLLAMAILIPLVFVVRRRAAGQRLPVAIAWVAAIIGIACTLILADGTPAVLAAVALLAIALVAKRRAHRLSGGRPTRGVLPTPLPPSGPSDRPPAPGFVPAVPMPPIISGPTAAALPRRDDRLADILTPIPPGRRKHGDRDALPVLTPLPFRSPVRALPPPDPKPQDPGIVPIESRRRRKPTHGR